jgi:glucose-1-phosphate thymidylyltransferase
MIKGVVLTGCTESSLVPKGVDADPYLLPVHDRPMVHYTLECLARSGVQEVLLVTSRHAAPDFTHEFDDGSNLDLQLQYACHDQPSGTGQALALAESFADGGPIVVMHGDNIVERTIAGHLSDYSQQGSGARVLLTPVADPEPFAVAEFEDGKLVRIVDKPQVPPSDLVAVGIYMYDSAVFNMIRNLRHESRGNVELTDVNNAYLRQDELASGLLAGWWVSAGTSADDYQAACILVARDGANRELDIGLLRPTG